MPSLEKIYQKRAEDETRGSLVGLDNFLSQTKDAEKALQQEISEGKDSAEIKALLAEDDRLEGELSGEWGELSTAVAGDRKTIEKLEQEMTLLLEDTLRKISGPMGTNEGGWYEDRETGKKYYIKIYTDPNQARTEFIVNAVYDKLGLKVPKTRLLNIQDQLAVAMEEIPNAKRSNVGELKSSEEVLRGFVADAYLANWDVVGLVYDNIVLNPAEEDGFYRIDNGGALRFRALGGAKNFPADRIDELVNMRNPDYSAGQVFGALTEEELRAQARELVAALADDLLRGIVEQSAIDDSDDLIRSLIGRKNFLRDQYTQKL